MKRNIVSIDEEKCTGCGLCASACHEGAIQMIDGKAKLISDSYCDGLGACLPACPADAISVVEREAEAFDEQAVANHLNRQKTKEAEKPMAAPEPEKPLACGCPGTHARAIERKAQKTAQAESLAVSSGDASSELMQWPCQIQLVPPNAPYLKNANLLIAADCTAYANANIHRKWMRGRITLIGCPKLDDADYAKKLADIFRCNDIQSVTVLRMSVPCCGGIVSAVKNAMLSTGVMVPWQVVTIDTNGEVLQP